MVSPCWWEAPGWRRPGALSVKICLSAANGGLERLSSQDGRTPSDEFSKCSWISSIDQPRRTSDFRLPAGSDQPWDSSPQKVRGRGSTQGLTTIAPGALVVPYRGHPGELQLLDAGSPATPRRHQLPSVEPRGRQLKIAATSCPAFLHGPVPGLHQHQSAADCSARTIENMPYWRVSAFIGG